MTDRTLDIVNGLANLVATNFFYIKWDATSGAFKYCSSTGTDISGNNFVAISTTITPTINIYGVATAGGTGSFESDHQYEANWTGGASGSNIPNNSSALSLIGSITNISQTTGLLFKVLVVNPSGNSSSIASFFTATILAGALMLTLFGKYVTGRRKFIKRDEKYVQILITSPNQITPTQLNRIVTANFS